MKKLYLVTFAILALCFFIPNSHASDKQTAFCLAMSNHDHRDHHHRNKKHDPRKDKEHEIEYRLDLLEAKYKRDKSRIENSRMDKYEKNMKKKELEYQYKKEKGRLKNEKKRVEKGSFYSN